MSHPTGAKARSKVTVPKPFQMMLREEEKKKHQVRTRSEIELENTLLRQELEELRECQKKFRATPAPAHIHLPLYEVISRRRKNIRENIRGSAAVFPKPFHFLEREKRKREARMEAELGTFSHREERRAFSARAMPSSVYGSTADTSKSSRRQQLQSFCTLEREVTDGQSDQSSDLEDDCRPQRTSSSKAVKKHIELSIEMVGDREWSPHKVPMRSVCAPQQLQGSSLKDRSHHISL